LQTSVVSGAPTATATGRRPLFRSTPAAGFAGLTFDADNGKDQYGPQTIAWSAIHTCARPPRSCIRREFNDGAHVSVLSGCRPGAIRPGDMPLFRTERG